jgi:uroporphyrinogen-III synthase
MVSNRLDGRRVVVTRAQGVDDALPARLRALGAEVLHFPAIVVVPPPSNADLDRALRDLKAFAWVAFASANAVEFTVRRMAELGVPTAALAAPRLAAVGPATAEALGRAVRAPDLVPADARGEALAAALAPEVRGLRVLVPRAEEGRPELTEGLAAAGAEVSAPVAYRTLPAPAEALRGLGDLLERGGADAVVFASPSAVRAVAEALGDRAGLVARAAVAVIGPTTAEAARQAGWPVSIRPSYPGAGALAEAIAARLGAGAPPGSAP